MRSRVFLILITTYGIFFLCTKKPPEPIVAKVGNNKITPKEFRDRYEFTPQLMLTKNKEQNKKRFLVSLLGEKILAEEGYQRHLHETDKFKTYASQMEKEAVVEALFEKEVTSKIEVSEQELREAFVRSNQELELQVLNFENEQDAQEATQVIDAGKSLREVKEMFQTQHFISADSILTMPLKWGQAHPDIEAAAYNLELNEVSDPISIAKDFFILKLVNKKSEVFITEADFYQQSPSLTKVIRRRKSADLFDEYLRSVMKDKKMRVSHEVFNFVAKELEQLFPIEDNESESNETTPQKRGVETILSSESLADRLNDTFARFEDGSTWTINEFIKKLFVGPYPLDYKSKERFRKSLRRTIRRMAEFEFLANKGYELGLQESKYVKDQTQMWNDAFIAQELRQSIIDTIKNAQTTNQTKILDNYLIELSKKHDISLNRAVFDTIQTHDLSMLVVKSHFPNRLAAPPVKPLYKTMRWNNKVNTILSKEGK